MPAVFRILALGGDGIGPEVVECALRVIDKACDGEVRVEVSEDLLHGAAWEAHGTFCRNETLEAAKAADAVLVGAVGGPQWDGIRVPGGPEMQDGLMRLRHELDAFAGLRPARAIACLESLTPYRSGLTAGADVMVLREMCGGMFFSRQRGIDRPEDGPRTGFEHNVYDECEIARLAHAGFRLARSRTGRLASADKSNVLESHVLWREVVNEVAGDYPDVAFENILADNASYQLACNPCRFDVIMTDNLFGDMLSDQAGAIVASLGMLPSACLAGLPEQDGRTRGIYEPVHGTAPDIAGQGIANPVGAILSAAMMFEYSLARPDIARRIDAAVITALNEGARTADLGGGLTSTAFTDIVLSGMSG